MVDTTWLCESSKTMQNILNDTSELYKINNIEVNLSKSDLLHICPRSYKSQTTPLLFNNQPILPRKSNDVIRYLGIYFDGNGSTKPTFDAIVNKIENFICLIKYKKLTHLQISSLFNLILQPSIEYLLQVCIIHNNLQTKLSCLFTIQTKKMLSLAKNTNNIVLTNPITFNLLTLNNLIQKTSSANIKHIFNSSPILKNIGIIHIKYG